MKQPYLDRFMAKVNITKECWLWTASLKPAGYGQFNIDGKILYAHRLSYEHFVGPIPKGLELDHLCSVRHCVRPDHLEPVEHIENIRRGATASKTHCCRGHELAGSNLGYNGRGNRRCLACHREQEAKRREHALSIY